jgi:hypothetical protein
VQSFLENSFLDRVRRAYHTATTLDRRPSGPIWGPIDARRSDVHTALLAPQNDELRKIFANPTTTDLYYGCDPLCRSASGPIEPDKFMELALACSRARYASGQINRLIPLLSQAGIQAVVEIGPGVGYAVFFAFRAGITDYTTIDLPLGMVAQACFLSRALGPNALWFDGEEPRSSVGKIKIFSAARLPASVYGVALNVDSMTEMPSRVAFDYATWLAAHARFFVSVNHLSNAFTIGELMAFTRMKRLSRYHCRPEGYGEHLDYLEEVYAPTTINIARTRRSAFYLFIGTRARLRSCASRIVTRTRRVARKRWHQRPIHDGIPSRLATAARYPKRG